jgi:hypothetical protein
MTTTTHERIKRRGDIRMNVSEDIKARLIRVSQVYGMPPSVLSALALGTWLAQQERLLQMSENLANKLGESMGDAVADEMRKQIGLFSKAPDKET